jgi:hypothetical protein
LPVASLPVRLSLGLEVSPAVAVSDSSSTRIANTRQNWGVTVPARVWITDGVALGAAVGFLHTRSESHLAASSLIYSTLGAVWLLATGRVRLPSNAGLLLEFGAGGFFGTTGLSTEATSPNSASLPGLSANFERERYGIALRLGAGLSARLTPAWSFVARPELSAFILTLPSRALEPAVALSVGANLGVMYTFGAEREELPRSPTSPGFALGPSLISALPARDTATDVFLLATFDARHQFASGVSLGGGLGALWRGNMVQRELGPSALLDLAYQRPLAGPVRLMGSLGAGGYFTQRDAAADPNPAQGESHAKGLLLRAGVGVAVDLGAGVSWEVRPDLVFTHARRVSESTSSFLGRSTDVVSIENDVMFAVTNALRLQF